MSATELDTLFAEIQREEALYRGEPDTDEVAQPTLWSRLGWGELLLGGAAVGLLLLAVLVFVADLAGPDGPLRRRRRRGLARVR